MRKPLTYEQRKFLQYILDNHNGMGWSTKVSSWLLENSYSDNDAVIDIVVQKFKRTVRNPLLHKIYNKPTKYLK